jgi:NADH-quinone oxidoreductase subunit C
VSVEPSTLLQQVLGDATGEGVVGTEDAFGIPTVDVARAAWVPALTVARDHLGLTFFDWLSAVDEQADGVRIVSHLWSVPERRHLLLRTMLPPDDLRVATAVETFPGAAWHERETHEMFGVEFVGHPNLRGLLLPAEFVGHPLRKEFVLAARAAKPWPGAKEPGESSHGGPSRRTVQAPGVPPPEWGPHPPDATPATTDGAGDAIEERGG